MTGIELSAASSVLERLPVTRWHWRLVLIVGLGTFFDLYEVFLGGVLAPVLATEFHLGTLGKAMVIAAGFAGMFVGANVLSIVADRLGRRRVFILNLLVYSLFHSRPRSPRTSRRSWCCASLPASDSALNWCLSTPTWPSSCPPGSVAG
jgi:MFS family permease